MDTSWYITPQMEAQYNKDIAQLKKQLSTGEAKRAYSVKELKDQAEEELKS